MPITKSFVKKFTPGTFEYVLAHGLWQKAKGRNPSATLPFQKNPSRAFKQAQRMGNLPTSKLYFSEQVPANYICGECGVTNCKLWRQYQTGAPALKCAACAAVVQKKDISTLDDTGRRISSLDGNKTDQIGWYVPAVPTEETGSYWGYSSVPSTGVDWWKNLPSLSEAQKAA
jgi:hypothetical protein